MSDAQTPPTISAAPAYRTDRTLLAPRASYDFRDYGFEIKSALGGAFEIVPITVSDEEAFLFFFAREDIAAGRYSLFNLHCFLKFIGTVEEFAHTRGASVATIKLVDTTAFGVPALKYDREIMMRDLFKGAESVIDFIGGQPDFLVRDSHTYCGHRHAHFYSGMIHPPGEASRYDTLRRMLFNSIALV